MLNAGLIEILVVDSHKAEFWKQIFPQLTLRPDIAVRNGGEIGWMGDMRAMMADLALRRNRADSRALCQSRNFASR